MCLAYPRVPTRVHACCRDWLVVAANRRDTPILPGQVNILQSSRINLHYRQQQDLIVTPDYALQTSWKMYFLLNQLILMSVEPRIHEIHEWRRSTFLSRVGSRGGVNGRSN